MNIKEAKNALYPVEIEYSGVGTKVIEQSPKAGEKIDINKLKEQNGYCTANEINQQPIVWNEAIKNIEKNISHPYNFFQFFGLIGVACGKLCKK